MADKPKPTEEEVQAWLDGVHFSSCCSDPLPENEPVASEKPLVDAKAIQCSTTDTVSTLHSTHNNKA